MATESDVFGKWRSRLWPVHSWEMRKVLPMALICFLALFNYTILRDVKDTLVVPSCGSLAIPFIKFWGTVPMAVLFLLIYTKLSTVLSKPALFYCSILPFLIFFPLFGFVLFPHKVTLEPVALSAWLEAHLSENLQVIGAVVRDWPCALFYVFAELWGSIAVSLLFWGFANDTTRSDDAKRLYPLYGLLGNFALVISGQFMVYLTTLKSHSASSVDAYQPVLQVLSIVVTAGALAMMVLYYGLNRFVLTDSRFQPEQTGQPSAKDKPKMGVFESFSYLAKSKHLLCIAILVLGYGMSINLVEVVWKSQLKALYPSMLGYNHFMGNFSTAVGVVSMASMLLLSGNILRRFGWKSGALLTPILLLVTGLAFFVFVLFSGSSAQVATSLGTTSLALAVFFGAVQNIISKSSKYALFDPTKEMAYIPLDQEQKVKGKAAIDVVGGRLGKSGGSVVYQLLTRVFGTIQPMLPYIALLIGLIIFGWIAAVFALGRRLDQLKDQAPIAEAPATA